METVLITGVAGFIGSHTCKALAAHGRSQDGLMKLAAQAVKLMSHLKSLKVHWTADAKAFDAGLETITQTLRVFRPITASDLVTRSPESGAPALAEVVREIQAADPARPLGKINKRQRAALRLQSELGDLVDRPAHLLRVKDQKPEGKKT
jgi:uncharacterized protein YbjT (DUF2867 family)